MPTYDTTVDSSLANNSHALMLELVGPGGRVLDVGCATGYLGAALKERGSEVAGVELDPEAAARAAEVLDEVVVADLETVDLVERFGPESFDVVVFGDVLEHLREPLRLLSNATGLLRPGGSVVISIPNVGHADVRLSLLQGRWRYSDRGLLDRTHVQFFTRSTLLAMLTQAGLVAIDLRRTTAPPLATELGVDGSALPDGVLDWVSGQPDATTYQFVLRAVRNDATGAVAAVTAERDALRTALAETEEEAAVLRAHVADLAGEVAAARGELRDLRSTLSMRALERPRRAYGVLRRAVGR
ncbi:class I SAM-dependent methyltransferase [Actinotalea solisilvae]|uniref:class I SAM-dependent methyltransferase n=1 Tax=Actinotalea solisilvae TaxID=2072922 RepID=UPI0018F189BA|nr:class I SAM-dependent methyltransferase [Actinotalea solisilvae]